MTGSPGLDESQSPAAAKKGSLGIAAPAATAFAFAVFMAALVHLCLIRSPWYDEFYTIYVTRPELGWYEALRDHWLADNHPPLFYMLARATLWLGTAVEARRFVNVIIAVVSMLAGTAVVRGGSASLRALAAPYFLLLASQAAALTAGAELRSYFLSFCSVALLLLMLAGIWLRDEPGQPRRVVPLTITAIVACNTHIATTLIAGSAILAFAALALVRRDIIRFRACAIPAAIAGAVFLATCAAQVPHWAHNTGSFWITPGLAQARWSITMELLYGATANLAMLVIGLGGLALLGAHALKDRRMPAMLELTGLLIIGAMLSLAAMIAVHLWRPFIVPKYLIGLIPIVTMILAAGYAHLSARLSKLPAAALLLVCTVSTSQEIWRNTHTVAGLAGWDGTAAIVARQVAACPQTAVHVDLYWNRMTTSLDPPDNAAVMPYAYTLMAKRNHFAIEPETSRRVAADCPTLFWAEHITPGRETAATIRARETARGFAIGNLYFRAIDAGWIASTRPLPAR
jgi:hypothetical protein